MLGGFLAGVALCAFGYFLYVKIKASRDAKSGGAGGRVRPGVKQK